jgi:hypothetical protein
MTLPAEIHALGTEAVDVFDLSTSRWQPAISQASQVC